MEQYIEVLQKNELFLETKEQEISAMLACSKARRRWSGKTTLENAA